MSTEHLAGPSTLSPPPPCQGLSLNMELPNSAWPLDQAPSVSPALRLEVPATALSSFASVLDTEFSSSCLQGAHFNDGIVSPATSVIHLCSYLSFYPMVILKRGQCICHISHLGFRVHMGDSIGSETLSEPFTVC